MAERAGSVEVVIKGGRPWGFTLQGGIENRSALTVAQIDPQGKARKQGVLQVGDHVIKINDVQCLSLADALQLIDCAFRTLTVLIWRSGGSSCDKDEAIPRNSVHRDSRNQLSKSSTRHSLRVKGSNRKSSGSADPSKCPPSSVTGHYPRGQKTDQSPPEQKSLTNDVVVWGPHCEKTAEIFDCANDNATTVPTSSNRIQLSPTDHHFCSGVTAESLEKRRHRHSSSASTASSCAVPSSPKDMVLQSSDLLALPRHQRSPRKLTKDSGYETSAQGEPDYVNADWISRDKSPPTPASSPDGYLSHRRNGNHCTTPSFSGDESFVQPHPNIGFSRNTQGLYSHGRDLNLSSYCSGGINRSFSCYSSSESLSLPPQLPPTNRLEHPSSSSRYSSTDSLVSWSSNRGAASLQTTASSPSLALHKGDRCTTTFQSSSSLYHYPDRPLPPPPYQGSSLSNLARSTPNLDIDADMVTRRFNKKRSVYEALANKSGLDFSPFIHRQPYWERRDVFEDDSSAKKHFGRSRGNSLPLEARDSGGPRSLPVCSNIIETKDSDARASNYRYRRSSQSSQPDSITTIPEKHSMVSSKDRSLSPPSIPTRDSSLRYRANSAHEKYPSWPVTSEVAEISSQVGSSSYRSNSWTQPTDYPKEHNTSYSRPKKLYQISTQQLHPVQEKASDTSARCTKSESLPHISHHQHEDPEKLNSYASEQGLTEAAISKYFNSEEAYHNSSSSGRFQPERDYNAHSPPERDTSVFDRGRDCNKFCDEESYTKKYGDMLRYYSQSPALYGNWSKDPSHGMTCDSNVVCDSNTPLLDRLRLEKQSHLPAWPPPQDTDTPSEAGTCTDSVDSNSSSQETLKWHGSYNDLSSLNARVSSMSVDYDSDQSTIADTGCLTPQTTTGTASPEGSHKNFVTRSDIQPNHFVRHSRAGPMPGHDKETVSFCVSGHKRELNVLNVQEIEKPIRQSSFSNHVTSHCNPGNGTSSYENRIQKLKEENKTRGVSQAFQTSFPGFSRSGFDDTHESNKFQSPNNGRVTSDSIPSTASSNKICDTSTSDKIHFSPPHSSFTPERRDSCSSSYNSHCWPRPKKDDRNEALHYLDSHKRHRISDPELKAIQKQAVLSFYHRQTALESGDFSDAKSDRSVNSFSPPHHQSSEVTVFNHPSSSPRSPSSKEKQFSKKPSPALPPKPKHHYASDALEKCPVSPLRHQPNFAKEHFTPRDLCHEAPQKNKQSVGSEKPENLPGSPSKKKSTTNESSFFNTSHAEFAVDHQHYFLNELLKNNASVSPIRPKPSIPSDRNASLPKPCATPRSKQHPVSPDNIKMDSLHEPSSPIGQTPTVLMDSSSSQATHLSIILDHSEIQPCIHETQDSSVVDVIYENVIPQPSTAKSAHASRELKERTVDQAPSHGFLWSHPGGRKAHLKKIYNSNETAVVKVISSEGETLVEAVETPDNPQHVVKPRIPPKSVNKMSSVVPSSSHVLPSPECSDLSPPAVIQDPEEDEELRQIEDSLQNQIKLSMLASTSSSPDLPLPPPPTNTDTEVLHTDDPLPPPPPLVITEAAEFVPKTDQRNFVSEPAAVSFSISYHHSDNCKPPNSPQSISETAALERDNSSQITPIVSKDFLHDDDVPNSSCQSQDHDFVEGDYSKVSAVLTVVQEPCVPHQSQCHQTEKSEKSVGEVPKMDEVCVEEEALYANLDLLRHHIRNGDTYSFVSNGLEQIPVPTAIIVTNSATQTSDSTPSLPRKQTKTGKSHAELECERLSRDFVKSFGDATLRNLLLPSPNHKTMSDYMEGLLDLELEKGGKPTTRPSLSNRTAVPDHVVHTTNINTFRDNVGLPLTSAYFTTSEPKAKLLTRYCHSLESKDWTNEVELKDKKEELIASIGKKLEILRFEQVALQDEVNQNEQLGREVTVKVQQLAKPNELEKYRLHVEELEKIINLLLSLSGRLARAQNALLILPKEAKPEERCILEAKRDKLYDQHEEARRLKESIDRRSQQVSQFLHDYLTKDEYADYDHFIKMKSKLLMDARELDENLKLGEEQLAALRGSLDAHLWNGPTLDLHSQTIVNRT